MNVKPIFIFGAWASAIAGLLSSLIILGAIGYISYRFFRRMGLFIFGAMLVAAVLVFSLNLYSAMNSN